MTPETHPVTESITLLRQGAALVERLNEAQFTVRPPVSPGASVGAQFRHCLDFWTCLLDGLPDGRVDYDRRERREEIEHVPGRAAELCARIVERLEAVRAMDLAHPLESRGDCAAGEPSSASSLGRELRFLISHTVHHYALIAMILRDLGATVDPGFGVAASTLRYWEQSSSRLA